MDIRKHRGALLALAAGGIILGMAVATQHVASTFNYPREFGPGWFDSGPRRFYAPWQIFAWEVAYGKLYRMAFALSEGYGLLVALAPIIIIVSLLRRQTPTVKA